MGVAVSYERGNPVGSYGRVSPRSMGTLQKRWGAFPGGVWEQRGGQRGGGGPTGVPRS